MIYIFGATLSSDTLLWDHFAVQYQVLLDLSEKYTCGAPFKKAASPLWEWVLYLANHSWIHRQPYPTNYDEQLV